MSMDSQRDNAEDEKSLPTSEDKDIDHAMLQMEILYKCRCVQPPHGSNVTIREIKKDE